MPCSSTSCPSSLCRSHRPARYSSQTNERVATQAGDRIAAQTDDSFRPQFVQFYPQPLVFAGRSAEVGVALTGDLSAGDMAAGMLPVQLVAWNGEELLVLDQADLPINAGFWREGDGFHANLAFTLRNRGRRLQGRLGITPLKKTQYRLGLRFPDGTVVGASDVFMRPLLSLEDRAGDAWVWNCWAVAERDPQTGGFFYVWGFSVHVGGGRDWVSSVKADVGPFASITGERNFWNTWNATGTSVQRGPLPFQPTARLLVYSFPGGNLRIDHRFGVELRREGVGGH